jgi:hypothetical protein
MRLPSRPTRPRVAPLLVLALAACAGDPPTGTGVDTGPTLDIIPAATSGTAPGLDGKQFSAAPGDTIRMSAQLRAANGTTTSPTLAWRSTDAAVAEVDVGGLVRARANGTANVIATSGGFADTLRVVVSACGSVRPIELAVGQVQAYETGQGMDLCVLAGTSAQEFAVIPYYAADSATRTVSLTMRASNAITVAADVPGMMADGSAVLSRAPATVSRSLTDAPRVSDVALHRALHRRSTLELDGARTARDSSTLLD